MKIFSKILKFIVTIFMILALSYNIINIINIRILKNDLTKVGGYSVLEVVSGSMDPTIKIGDLIIIDTSAKKYKVNDIVTFYDVNSSFVTHRIISIDKDKNMMVTKGDFNDSKDDPISMKNIVGKYKYKIPFLGMLFKSFKNPVVLVIVFLIGLLLSYLFSTDDDGKLMEDKKESKKKTVNKKNTSKKKTSSTKTSTKKSATKSSTAKKPASKTQKTVSAKKKEEEVKKPTNKKTSSAKTSTKKSTTKSSPAKKITTKTPKTVSTRKKEEELKKPTKKKTSSTKASTKKGTTKSTATKKKANK